MADKYDAATSRALADLIARDGRRVRHPRQRRRQAPALFNCQFKLVKSTAAVAKGSTGTFNVYNLGHAAKGSETVVPSTTIQAYVRWGAISAANKWALAISFNDDRGWEILIAEC